MTGRIGTMLRMVSLIAMIVPLSACTTRLGDLTVASTKNLPVDFQIVRKGVKGVDCARVVLLLIPLGTLNPSIDSAVDDALRQVPEADALIDASTWNDQLFAFLYSHNCWRVEGTAIRTR